MMARRAVACENDLPLGYFALSGVFDPDDITQQLGTEPSWTHRVGDPGPPDAVGPRLGAEWALCCNEDTASDVADQVIAMVVGLRPVAEQVATLAAKFRGTLHLFSSSVYADWFLTPSLLRELANLNVDVRCEHLLVDPAMETRGAHAN